MNTQVEPKPSSETKPDQKEKPQGKLEERPPQAEELLCTICGMRSCWR